jgi:diguanylate cyclase (GGDEF)-like protein
MGLLFALLIAVAHFQTVTQQRLIQDIIANKRECISSAIAFTYAPFRDRGGISDYRRLTDYLMSVDPDLSYVVVADSGNRTLFADTRGLVLSPKKVSAEIDNHRVISAIRRLGFADNEEFRHLELPVVLGSNKRGMIRVGFSSRSIDDAISDMQSNLLAVFAMAFLIGILGAVSLAKTVADPLKTLMAAANAVGEGDLDTVVRVTSDDEIGRLGTAFNRMTSEIRNSHDRLVMRANTDSLTGLYNHRCFHERLAAEVSRTVRYSHPLSVILLDIDHFKALNDMYGHPVGDRILHEMAALLVGQCRDIDTVARYGGEEFAVILPETIAMEGLAVAERLRNAVQDHRFQCSEGLNLALSISLGVAEYPSHSAEREDLVIAADLAMYQAKSSGRNRSVLFNSFDACNDTDPHEMYMLLHAEDMGTIEAIAAAVDSKGQREQGFSKAVMEDSLALANELMLSKSMQEDIRIASLLHDIGKLAVSGSILTKTGALSEEEWRIVRCHAVLGYGIVQKSPHLKSMLPGILNHHERWDGTGYPNGLQGEDIPLIARIISVVDAYHAMTTDCAHRKPMSSEEARAELIQCAGTQFDPVIVTAYLRLLDGEDIATHAPAA